MIWDNSWWLYTWEENVHLSQAITQLETTQSRQGRDADEQTVELNSIYFRSQTCEAETLGPQLEDMKARLAEEQRKLGQMLTRAESAEVCTKTRELSGQQQESKLYELRSVWKNGASGRKAEKRN